MYDIKITLTIYLKLIHSENFFMNYICRKKKAHLFAEDCRIQIILSRSNILYDTQIL